MRAPPPGPPATLVRLADGGVQRLGSAAAHGVLRRHGMGVANALLVAYNPHTTGLGFAPLDLLIVAAWGAAGLLIAIRKFSWLPLGR